MNLLGSFLIACSMYSAVPVPQVAWTGERMRRVLCFFPLIGAGIGLAFVLAYELCRLAGAGPLAGTFVLTAVPLLLTGGIHMDGYLDVTDARRSYASREKRLAIMKDPHTGAFALIGLGLYLLIYAAAVSELTREAVRLMPAVFVAERALSAVSVVSFPAAKKEGLAARFSEAAGKRGVLVCAAVYLAASLAWLLLTGKLAGLACAAAVALTFFWYRRMALREFGGVTGDLAGCFVQCCERNGVLLLAAVSLLQG